MSFQNLGITVLTFLYPDIRQHEDQETHHGGREKSPEGQRSKRHQAPGCVVAFTHKSSLTLHADLTLVYLFSLPPRAFQTQGLVFTVFRDLIYIR